MAGEARPTLIEQALAAAEAAHTSQPDVVMGGPIDVTPEQALVWSVYQAIRDAARGWGRSDDVDRAIRSARAAGIDEHEIEAAISAANEGAT